MLMMEAGCSSETSVNILHTILFRITGGLDFVHQQIFQKLENTKFRKLDLFPSVGVRGEGVADTYFVESLWKS
jgi:hypothetical protein